MVSVSCPANARAAELDGDNPPDQQALVHMMQTLRACNRPELREQLSGVELQIDPSDDVLAYSEKGRIVISRGLLVLFKDKDFLHFVLAHELSHHLLSHLERSRRMFPGELFEETVTAALRQYFEFELEADAMAVATLTECRVDTSRISEHLERLIASTREATEIPQLLHFQQRRLGKLKSLSAH
jgi:predicted Zn-dependent protease